MCTGVSLLLEGATQESQVSTILAYKSVPSAFPLQLYRLEGTSWSSVVSGGRKTPGSNRNTAICPATRYSR